MKKAATTTALIAMALGSTITVAGQLPPTTIDNNTNTQLTIQHAKKSVLLGAGKLFETKGVSSDTYIINYTNKNGQALHVGSFNIQNGKLTNITNMNKEKFKLIKNPLTNMVTVTPADQSNK